MDAPAITADERRAAASLLLELQQAGVRFGDSKVTVLRDLVSGRLSVQWDSTVAQRLPSGRLLAARPRAAGGIDLCDLSAGPPFTFAALLAGECGKPPACDHCGWPANEPPDQSGRRYCCDLCRRSGEHRP